MRLAISSRFQRQLRVLPEPVRHELSQAACEVLAAFGKPHVHQGLGIRKIHCRGVYEFRVGRSRRVVFTHPEKDLLMLHFLGNHREVQHFLDSW